MNTSDIDDTDQRALLAGWARTQALFAAQLRTTEPEWGSESFPLAAGMAVLHGAGLYVNRAIGAGLDGPITHDELSLLEARSGALGVPAAVDVAPVTHPGTVEVLRSRHYEPIEHEMVFACRLRGVASDVEPDSGGVASWLRIEAVSAERVAVWQSVARRGWGHEREIARRASDAYAAAASVVDQPGLLLAVDTRSREAIGCASLNIVDGIATLGGMSTLPEARGRGVQAALIAHRVSFAEFAGSRLAVSMAAPGSSSARNLVRAGLDPWFELVTWEQRSRD